MSEQYDEQDDLSVETAEDPADVEETTDQSDQPETGLEPGESPAAELEDQYGEANDGPEVEDDPRLDTEVTDETTDLEMGLDDTEGDGRRPRREPSPSRPSEADVELSEDIAAVLADDPADSADDEPVSAEVAEVAVDDELDVDAVTETDTEATTDEDGHEDDADESEDDADELRLPRPTRSRSSAPSCGPSPVTGSSCTPTPAWRTG